MVGYKLIKKDELSFDLRSGFTLFLIALPLCVGIALASGAPASAGIIAGVIGGTLGALMGGARLSINGPAAGMIVVVVNGITSLSDGDAKVGFQRFLACVCVVGVLQILSGLAGLGKYALLAPGAVIHGMMAAIGSIILIKQLPVLVGVKPNATSLLGTVAEMPSILARSDLPIAMIGVLCLVVLMIWNNVKSRITQIVPGPLVAVIVGLSLSIFFHFVNPHQLSVFGSLYEVGPKFLVPLPTALSEFLTFPLFDEILTARSFMVILTVYMVGSLESQLSTLAVDKLDPLKRGSDYDQEFIGKGLTNLTCGLVGGLPVITEIVRSSANIATGAKSPASNVIHGVLLAVAVVLIPDVLRQIPLTSLAAVLLIIGFRLAHPLHFKEAMHAGWDSFAAFFVTWAVTIADDLLVGLGLGLIIYVVSQLIRGVKIKAFYSPDIITRRESSKGFVEVRGALVFSGYIAVLGACSSMPDASEVFLDLGSVTHLDNGVRNSLEGLEGQMKAEGKDLKVIWPRTKAA